MSKHINLNVVGFGNWTPGPRSAWQIGTASEERPWAAKPRRRAFSSSSSICSHMTPKAFYIKTHPVTFPCAWFVVCAMPLQRLDPPHSKRIILCEYVSHCVEEKNATLISVVMHSGSTRDKLILSSQSETREQSASHKINTPEMHSSATAACLLWWHKVS